MGQIRTEVKQRVAMAVFDVNVTVAIYVADVFDPALKGHINIFFRDAKVEVAAKFNIMYPATPLFFRKLNPRPGQNPRA